MAVAILLGTIICVVGLFGLNKASSFVIKDNNLPVLTFLLPGFNENYYLKNIENEKNKIN